MQLSSRVRLLLVSTNADLSGAPLQVLDLASSLPQSKFDIELVFGETGPVAQQADLLGFPTHVIRGIRSKISPILDVVATVQFYRLVRHVRPDVLHSHSTKAGMIVRVVGALLKIPVVYTVHGWGFGPGRRLLQSIVVRSVERLLVSRTARYMAVSEHDRQQGIDLLGITPDKIVTVRNRGRFAESPSELRTRAAKVIMVARYSAQKDYVTFAQSLSQAEFDSASLVGDGTKEPGFVSEMMRLSGTSSQKIRFVGKSESVGQLLEESSIFVLSSQYEGLPLSILEAMSKGLPIIASDVGGVSELVIHGENGFLFPAGNVKVLSEYISLLSSDVSLRRKMGDASLRVYKEKFQGNQMVEATMSVYDRVLEEFEARRSL